MGELEQLDKIKWMLDSDDQATHDVAVELLKQWQIKNPPNLRLFTTGFQLITTYWYEQDQDFRRTGFYHTSIATVYGSRADLTRYGWNWTGHVHFT